MIASVGAVDSGFEEALDSRILIETPEETALREETGEVITEDPEVEQINKYVCDSTELNPSESQAILDLLKDGFTVDEIAGQTEKNDERDELQSNKLILVDPTDENKAVQAEVPNKKFNPWEISQFLNNYIDGPFSFGIVLTDSLRMGRCEEADSNDCSLTGSNLKLRNSGAGIMADLKPVKEVFSSFFDGNSDFTGFSEEENEVLRTALNSDTEITEDGKVNASQIKTAKRLESELIPNSILTAEFSAELQTNCNESSCVISTYSLFDKYFNSWMSTELVVSAFGPSLLYRTKKLFGWTGRRGYFSGVKEGYQSVLDDFRMKYVKPGNYLGNIKKTRIDTKINKYGWKDWYQSMVGGNSDNTGFYLFKTEEFQIWWGKAQAKGGWLENIKSAEERSELIRMLKDMRSVMRGAQARNDVTRETFQQAKKMLGANHAVTKQKFVEYGRDTASWMDEVYDGMLGADYIEWVNRHPNAGFYNKGLLQVRPGGEDEVINLFNEHRNLRTVLKKFHEDGTFRGFENEFDRFGSVYGTQGDNLKYYVFDRDSATNYRGLSYSNLERAATNMRDTFVDTDMGEMLPFNKASVPFVQSRIGGNAKLYQGKWKPAGVLTPEDITARITNARTGPVGNMSFGTKNIETMLESLQEKNWVSRRYWGSLDKLMAQEDELIRSYFTIKGGAKWTALPFGYWWAKKGFGIEGISQYQLPDTWTNLEFEHGEENIYDYAYVDFFANEGSDQGDLFMQVINKLPWKIILDEVSKKYNPVRNLYDSLTKNELRDETENLAFYLTGPEECVNCKVVIKSQDLTEFKPFFFVENKKLTSYILEDTVSEEARAVGQTLIAFAGHTNLVGKTNNEGGEPIDLVEAIGNDDVKTCSQAVEELNFYGVTFGKYIPNAIADKGRIGAVLGGMESLTYGAFFWAGIFSTIAIQVAIAPQLHGCVDVDEGYYAHYFIPAKEEETEEEGVSLNSTEKVSELVDNFRETFVDGFEGDSNSLTQSVASEIGDEIEKFSKDAKNNNIVQATIKFDGLSSGQMDSKELFYFWCGKGCVTNPASYKTKGSEELRGVNDIDVGIDFEQGQITRDGVPIVQSEDNVRMASTNLSIPAVEIPHTVTQACLENTSDVAIEINASGEVFVLNEQLWSCISDGVLEQTGLPMTQGPKKLNDVFGPLELVITNTHPGIQAMGDKIIAEGVPRKVADGKDSKLFIQSNKDVNLSSSNDEETSVGKLESLQFANGVIVVKPDGCFLVWLKHHADGILSNEYVEGIKPKLEREYNPETQCVEPSINFELLADEYAPNKSFKVDTFNGALAHLGPFTIFETPTKRIAISSEFDPELGECKDHMRVIDKETGEIEEYTGAITQTPDGFKINTDDGDVHEVKFSTKDGAPFIQLDEEKPELLNAAQGKNGSFYYDPDKGLWFAENAQLLPLIEAFREGIAAKVQPNGETTATASGNVLNLNVGQGEDSSFLNLPSLPENSLLLVLMFSLLISIFVSIRRKKEGE